MSTHPLVTRCRVWRNHRGFHGEVLSLGRCRAWHVSLTQHDLSGNVVYRSPFMSSFDTWDEAMDHAHRETRRDPIGRKLAGEGVMSEAQYRAEVSAE